MARVDIKHKCVMMARDMARRESKARVTGRSVFIKRCYGSYRLIGVEVSKRQRTCRDIFAEAQRMASMDLECWNKKRHWSRVAKRHKIRGAHRMAVSYYYRMLKDIGESGEEVMENRSEERLIIGLAKGTRTRNELLRGELLRDGSLRGEFLRGESVWMEKSRKPLFFYKRDREKDRVESDISRWIW